MARAWDLAVPARVVAARALREPAEVELSETPMAWVGQALGDQALEAQVSVAQVPEDQVSEAVCRAERMRPERGVLVSQAKSSAFLERFLARGQEASAAAQVAEPEADRGTEPARVPDQAKTKSTGFWAH